MAWNLDKETGDLVFDGFENGIAPSPQRGIANMQGVNISTELEEVMCSYSRTQQSQIAVANGAGTLTASSGAGAFYLSTNPSLQVGTWIFVESSTITSININTKYYVNYKSNGQIQLSAGYDPSASNSISHATSGTAVFHTFVNMGQPVQAATELYFDLSNNQQYRYYVLDNTGYVWVYDTLVFTNSLFASGTGTTWFLPSPVTPTGTAITNASGIAIFNGYIHIFIGSRIYVQESATLGYNNSGNTTIADNGWDLFIGGSLNSLYNSANSHYAIVSQSNTLTYCDGGFVGTIESTSNSGSAAVVPVWSYGSYTFSGSTLTVTDQIGGSNLLPNSTITFTVSGGGTAPTMSDSSAPLTTLYYVKAVTINGTATTFTIAASVGGSAISLSGGSGTQYFNTYKPSHSSGNTTYIFSPQALTLPFNAVSQCLCEIGTQIVVGCISNIVYFWDEISALASDFITIPENNVKIMINVNNTAYMFAGSKGNIYITQGSLASAVISVPDYCAGIPGIPTSYIEPYFAWGGAAFIRGRVYFSVQDQTTTKTGNCGGLWSFVPTQNLFPGQDVGLSLRMEAQNSYGTYNGVANVILNSQNQSANGPQYWAAWTSSVSSPAYGIDFSATVPYTGVSGGTGTTPFTGMVIIETDVLKVGSLLNKESFAQVEYKLSTPAVSGEVIGINYRANMTDAWMPLKLTQQELLNPISAIFVPENGMQNLQWVQFQIVMGSTPTTPSFVRLRELRLR